VFSFGDASTHAGSFVFQSGVDGKLKQTWSWPVNASYEYFKFAAISL
jgi:hypothetical protein